LQVEGLDHDWDRLIHKVKVEKSARDSRYSTELNGSKYVILIVKLKSPVQIEAMREAGRVSALALRRVGEAVEPGITTAELDAIAERVIRAEGGIPAFKGYGGFPGSICASVNDQIVHGIPSKRVKLREGDIISIDTGAIVDGWVGDNAWTYPVGEVAPEVARLLASSACGKAWPPPAPRSAWGTSGTRCSPWPRRRASAWCASTWATASGGICTRTPMCLTSGGAARG
jgi:Xaa-Pro aminopeptidase